MEWKEFLKPTKIKILVFVIVLLLFYAATSRFMRNLEFDSNPCDTYTADVGIYLPLYLPMTIIYGIHNALYCNDFMCYNSYNCKSIPNYLSNIGFIIELSYIYIISCIIVFMIVKMKGYLNK